MPITVETIQSQIPSYLTQDAKEGLAKALESFPKNTNYYTSRYSEELLQGDGWSSLELLRFEDGQRKPVKGILLSNSCDIAPENRRDLPARAVFAPIIPFSRYLQLLTEAGIDPEKIKAKSVAIREQRITTLLFLPKGAVLNDDYIAHLDDLHTIPLASFLAKTDRQKLFTLSQVGFYIFILKLSIHFCRFHENLARD